MKRFYTAESVTEGHPDKLCDLIADSILDACLKEDENSRVACEVLATKGNIIVAGEITSRYEPQVFEIVRKVLESAGYEADGIHMDAMDPKTELIDYDALAAKAKEYKPKLIVAGASSYSRLIDYERIAKTAKEVGAYFMVDMAHIAGLVAAKVIPSPIPYADFVTSSTTKTFCSARSGMVFCKAEHAKLLDKGTFPGALGSIQLHTMAAKAWSFKYAATPEFRATMEQVVKNAKCLAEELERYGFRIVSGGTDNHLLVADLCGKHITGKDFQNALDAVGITVNKNMVPFDPEKPGMTSGVRIGLTAVSQRGLKEPEIRQIAAIMNKIAEAPHDEKNLQECKAEAEELIARFPLYPAGAFDED